VQLEVEERLRHDRVDRHVQVRRQVDGGGVRGAVRDSKKIINIMLYFLLLKLYEKIVLVVQAIVLYDRYDRVYLQ
jgi:hypothetical protein